MITNLRTAIYTIGQTITSASGGFYYSDAPQEASTPYIEWYLLDDVYSRQDTSITEDVFTIQFSLFDRRLTSSGNKISSVTLETVAEQLISKFDATNLTITGYTSVDLVRQYTRPAAVIEEGEYWQIIIVYQLILNK